MSDKVYVLVAWTPMDQRLIHLSSGRSEQASKVAGAFRNPAPLTPARVAS